MVARNSRMLPDSLRSSIAGKDHTGSKLGLDRNVHELTIHVHSSHLGSLYEKSPGYMVVVTFKNGQQLMRTGEI